MSQMQVRWFDSAPIQRGRPWLLASGLLLMPAVAGVLLQWSAGLTGALLIPGFVARWALANKIARQGGQGYRGLLSVGTRTGLGLLTGLSVVLVDHVQPSYGAPLVFVLGYLLLLEPAWWLAWKHAEKAASAPGVGDTP
jgi:hypothetical protein